MNIMTSYTLRCLRRNRVRTLVTIIGIILSVVLFTAVSEGAVSGQQYLINVAKAQEGAYHGLYGELSDGELAELREAQELEALATLDAVGWAHMGNPNSDYPYLRIRSMSDNLSELLAVRLLEGRMPENETELLISDRAEAVTGVALQVGQRLELRLGQRQSAEGEALGEHNPYQGQEEHLVEQSTRFYTVVGVYHRLSSAIEGYDMPGSLALTLGPSIPGDHLALFTLKQIGDIDSFLAAHPYGSTQDVNRDLLLFSGVSGNRALVNMLYGLTAVLFGLIFFGSVALIYNSFSISVSERTKQFGLLKSIGATNRQLRRAVLTEAGLLCLVAIPLGLLVGCGGIGLTLGLLRPYFGQIVNLEGSEDVPMGLRLSLPALGLSAGTGLLTALVSAWIPAKRATRLSPMAAVRQSGDVKLRGKAVKVSRLTGRLFGFPGLLAAKNFKRSRRKYRATVISLFMSIVLFISAASFAEILRGQVAENFKRYPADLIVMESNPEGAPVPDWAETYAALRECPGITGGLWAQDTNCTLQLARSQLSADTLEFAEGQEEPISWGCFLFFLPEEDYAALCREAGVDPGPGDALIYDRFQTMLPQNGGVSYATVRLLGPEALPLSAELRWERSSIPGYQLLDLDVSPEGEILSYIYEPMDSSEDLLVIPAEEASGRAELRIAGLLKEKPLACDEEAVCLYLPFRAEEGLMAGTVYLDSRCYFLAEDHSQGRAALAQRLTELGAEQVLSIYDTRSGKESSEALLLVLNVFTFGFIVLISLIAAANVFNTISTNVALRRREFATLKSVGMGDRAFGRMMRFECLLYGSKALLWGLPVSVLMSWLIWRVVSGAFRGPYRLPLLPMAIAVGSVFLVVFATMLYATGKIKKDNPMDALKTENL